MTDEAMPEPPRETSGAVVRTFPCDQCGGDLEFHIGTQNLKCGFCGYEKVIDLSDEAAVVENDFATALASQSAKRLENQGGDSSGDREVNCEACGGTILFEGTTISTECPYCGSPTQADSFHEAQARIPIDGVLPFMVERETAKENLKAWVESRWFAPSDFKARGVSGKFNGIYMPHWTYDAMTFTRYRGERGEYYYTKNDDGERVRRTRWYSANGSFQRFFDDVLICALRDAKQKLMRELEPWPLENVLPFNQEALAGYLAMAYEVELDEGFRFAKDRMAQDLRDEVRQRIGGDEQRIHAIDTRHDAVTYKNVILPVWMLAYQYNQKSYQVVVNACTGEVQGERPWSWIKIGLTVLAAAATIGLIYLTQQ
ncbi:MAG: hypothetical protein VX834_13820 [Myxococcota bacterium]|nr:hypothetical protein [Myxococcota bacterium]